VPKVPEVPKVRRSAGLRWRASSLRRSRPIAATPPPCTWAPSAPLAPTSL